MSVTIGVFEVATATLIASLASFTVAYLNYRSGEYTSLDDRQRELTQALDNRTITYAFSGNNRVHEHSDDIINSLEMHVKSPRVFDRALQDRDRKELKEKIFPRHQHQRYTRVQVKFDLNPAVFPDLYDVCVFSEYYPSAHTGDFKSIYPDNEAVKISVVNRLSQRHFELEVVSDRPTDVLTALDSFYGAILTAIVRREIFERGDLHPMVKRSLVSDLEETIENYERLNDQSEESIMVEALDEEVLAVFRGWLTDLKRDGSQWERSAEEIRNSE